MKYLTIFLLAFSLLYANMCEKQLFSLDTYQKSSNTAITVKDILKEISKKCHITILFKDQASKNAINKKLEFVNIKDYTFDDFLDFLFDTSELFYSFDKEKSVIKLSYYKTEVFNIDYVNVSKQTSKTSKSIDSGSASTTTDDTTTDGNSGGDHTEITTETDFTFWDNLKNNILKFFDNDKDAKIILDKEASMLTVRGNKVELKKVKDYINQLMKRLHKEILIEAKIIEVTYNDDKSTGIDWSQFQLSITGSSDATRSKSDGIYTNQFRQPNYLIGYNFSVEGMINFLKTQGKVKILSNPKVLTLNNQPAIINVGQQLSYRYQTGSVVTTGGTAAGTNTYQLGSTFVGITLFVIPEISDNDNIILKINPVVSNLTGTATPQTTIRELPPDIKVKQMTSIVKLKNNQKVVIGGLISISNSTSKNGVNGLSKVPILGALFRHNQIVREKSEMFILISPKVISDGNMPSIKDLKLEKSIDFNVSE